jgi:hypothetical protein
VNGNERRAFLNAAAHVKLTPIDSIENAEIDKYLR